MSVAALMTAVSACDGGHPAVTTRPPPIATDMAAFTSQRPAWKPCGGGQKALCAHVKVPLSYEDPAGGTISLALNRFPATGRKKGSLLVNPGGPGGSGLEFAAWVAQTPVAAAYDVVGFDPRGVGASGQIHCLGQAEHDAYYNAPLAPTTADGRKQRRQAAKNLAHMCGERYRALLPRVGTDSTAQDMEVMRSILGDSKLNFLGASYGTLIGQYYAERYPARVGRMYLDSVMDPARSLPDIVRDNAHSAQQTFERFVDHCLSHGSCPLGTSRRQAQDRVLQMIDKLDAQPAPAAADPKRPVTGSDLRSAIGQGIEKAAVWPQLTQALDQAATGNLDGIRQLADAAHDREDNGTFSGEDETFIAVACTLASPQQRSHQALDRAITDATRTSPVFGPLDLFRPCADWPAHAPVTPHKLTADTPGPLLLANNTVDPATPLHWAKAASQGLHDATLVSNAGTGHGFMVMGPCTQRIMAKYLTDGAVPKAGTMCKDTGLKSAPP
ncbi:alpha/beta hydrolase [Streptomyces sp. NPDC000229]|uniref:alpha/beta hydrolase n=1 Tax=Streptomyces sp. NPDC000229 TaxID=3154247 RepID=UPI0033179F75